MVNREKDLLISQLTLLLREFKTRLEKAETQNDELRSETSYQQKVLARQQQHHHELCVQQMRIYIKMMTMITIQYITYLGKNCA